MIADVPPKSPTKSSPKSTPWVAILYSAIEPVGRRGGGIHNAVMAHALALRANGIGVTVFTSSEAFAVEADTRGITVDLDRAWRRGIDPLLSSRIWHHARRHEGRRPAAVIHNSGRTWLAGPILFPRVLQAQVMHRETTRPYRFFRHWLTLSEPYAAALRETPHGRHRKIAVAPNGLPDIPAPPPIKQPTGPVIIGSAGRLGEAKGTNALIDAALRVKESGADIRFKIAGPDPEPFVAQAKAKGISDIVKFVGWIDNLDAFLDQLDIFCLASTKESFGIVLIEAMARGLPVIATATNGAREVIGDDPVGWLVPIADTETMASTMSTAAADRTELANRGQAAFQKVRTHFTPEPVGRELIKALAALGAPLSINGDAA